MYMHMLCTMHCACVGGISEFGVLHPSLCEVSVSPLQRAISTGPRATTPGNSTACVLIFMDVHLPCTSTCTHLRISTYYVWLRMLCSCTCVCNRTWNKCYGTCTCVHVHTYIYMYIHVCTCHVLCTYTCTLHGQYMYICTCTLVFCRHISVHVLYMVHVCICNVHVCVHVYTCIIHVYTCTLVAMVADVSSRARLTFAPTVWWRSRHLRQATAAHSVPCTCAHCQIICTLTSAMWVCSYQHSVVVMETVLDDTLVHGGRWVFCNLIDWFVSSGAQHTSGRCVGMLETVAIAILAWYLSCWLLQVVYTCVLSGHQGRGGRGGWWWRWYWGGKLNVNVITHCVVYVEDDMFVFSCSTCMSHASLVPWLSRWDQAILCPNSGIL